MEDIKSGTPLADALALADAARVAHDGLVVNADRVARQVMSNQEARQAAGELTALRALAEVVRAHLVPADGKAPEAGECGWCERTAPLVAVMGSDTDTQVCAECHADPDIPTISMAALADETPVFVIARGDLAEQVWRDVTAGEAAAVLKYIENSGRVSEALSDAVHAVCGTPPGTGDDE